MNSAARLVNRKRALMEAIVIALLLIPGGLLLFGMQTPATPKQVELAGFATSLKGRTASQQHNARKAAQRLNGVTIEPGAVFSFNKTVKSWTWDAGFVKAPVSYDGELVKAYGGGVCQTSTTLYNAALLSGLPIVERHAHVFAPHYVPPGRDAAVAQYDIDLRFRNPYKFPLHLTANVSGDRLEIRISGAARPAENVQVAADILSATTPVRLTRVVSQTPGSGGRAYIRNPGAIGYRVVSSRIFSANGAELRREPLGDDTYQAMNRIVNLAEDETPQRRRQ